MNEASKFADGDFRVECNEMVLVRGGANPMELRGPGEIWLDADGTLHYKVFLPDDAYCRLRADLNRVRVTGQIVDAGEYFRLEAQQFSGPIWVSEQVFPTCRGGLGSGVGTGTIHRLVQRVDLPIEPNGRSSVVVRFLGKLQFSPNQGTEVVRTVGQRELGRSMANDSAQLEAGDFRFEARHEGGHTVISASFPDQVSLDVMEMRIRETMQFVLGREVDVVALEATAEGASFKQLMSSRRTKVKGRVSSPLKFQPFDFGGHFWRLFGDYFRYVMSHEGPGWHPVSEHLGSAIEASAGSIGTEILALSVAVEGVAAATCSQEVPEDASLLDDLARASAAISATELSERTRNRISGALDSMRSIRNSDLLRAFVANHGLPIRLFRAWGSLRHAAAHGASLNGRELDVVVALRGEVTMLLYSMVFDAIGYAGPRIDYATSGWPEANWPVSVPESEVEPAPEPAPGPAPGPTPNPMPKQ